MVAIVDPWESASRYSEFFEGSLEVAVASVGEGVPAPQRFLFLQQKQQVQQQGRTSWSADRLGINVVAVLAIRNNQNAQVAQVAQVAQAIQVVFENVYAV